jgi:pimeloyl-[acyl-carrier protein] methyl ester esterase
MFLHGFGANPAIWDGFKGENFPSIDFSNLQDASDKLAKDLLGDNLTLAGWSMGGMLAILLAAKFPEKIKRLILISTTPKFTGEPCGISPAILHKLRKQIRREGISAFHKLITEERNHPGLENTPIEQAERELDELERTDVCDLLPQIKTLTLIIHGDRDRICLPAAAEYLKSKIENSKLVMLPGIGHAPMLEAPEMLRQYVG